MRCPNCHANLRNESQLCPNCGTYVRYEGLSAETAAGSALALGKKARLARLEADYTGAEFLSARAYNAVIIGVLLYGIIVNVILCFAVGDVYRYINPALFLVLYFVCAIAGTIITARSSNPWVSFLGYNLVVVPLGLTISTLVEAYGGIGSGIVTTAFLYTGLITFGMLGASMAFPELFEKIGGALLACLIGLVLCELVLLLFRVPQYVTDWFAAGLFSLYIGYDIYRSQQFAKTLDNAVDCALDIYLDVANLFIRILSILARSKSDD